MPTAISTRMPPVTVEFDAGPLAGQRSRTHFEEPHKAKRFYAAKLKAGKHPKVVKGKLPAEGKAAAKKETKKAGKVERDAYGSKVGSQAARIAAALSKTPQSPKDIAEKAKANAAATASHLRSLAAKKLIQHTKDGYKLK